MPNHRSSLVAIALGAAGLLAASLPTPAQAQTPKRGGILNFAVTAEPADYDCHASQTFALIHPVAPHYSLLVRH